MREGWRKRVSKLVPFSEHYDGPINEMAGQVECMGNELVKSDNLEDLASVSNVLN